MVSKHQSDDDGENCLLINHFDSTNWQWNLHVFSLERFEIKMQLNWPHPFQRHPFKEPSPSTLVSYADGTLCIYDKYHSDIALWNHVTAELNIVPRGIAVRDNELNSDFRKYVRYHEQTIFERQFHKNSVIHGFGYDQIKDDYKILQYVQGNYSCKDIYPLWEIYSLKNKSWKKLHLDDMPTRRGCWRGDLLCLNGVCHWWGDTREETYVVSFNLNTERYVTTLLPKSMHDLKTYRARHLILLDGHVAVISKHAIEFNSAFNISIVILGELGVKESWTKLFDFKSLPNMHYPRPIGVRKQGDLLFIDNDQITSYDLTTGITENILLKEDTKDVLGERGYLAHPTLLYNKDIIL